MAMRVEMKNAMKEGEFYTSLQLHFSPRSHCSSLVVLSGAIPLRRGKRFDFGYPLTTLRPGCSAFAYGSGLVLNAKGIAGNDGEPTVIDDFDSPGPQCWSLVNSVGF
jgi:hypothetical protein